MNSLNPMLFIVATPLGNLKDISFRALEVLNQVDLIAAEDKRHSTRLLDHYGIRTPLISYHEHNEQQMTERLVAKMKAGERIALIADAGTPLISDPGFDLVQAAHRENLGVTAVPGPSALTAALSVAGLPTDRFVFEGFLPSKQVARMKKLQSLKEEERTLVFYEAPHRILDSIVDVVSAFGEERMICVVRELSKKFEQICRGSGSEILSLLEQGDIPQKGEFVVLCEGGSGQTELGEWESLLRLLLKEMSPARSASILSQYTGLPRQSIYEAAMGLKNIKA